MADLVFGRSPYAGGPVNLVFGAGLPAPDPDPLFVTGTTVLGGFGGYALATYDNRNPRRASNIVGARHDVAATALRELSAGWGLSAREIDGIRTAWEPAARAAVPEFSAAWGLSGRLAGERATPWVLASAVNGQTFFTWQRAESLRQQTDARWQTGQRQSLTTAIVHQAALSLVRQALNPWQVGQPRQALVIARWGSGVARLAELLARWEIGRPLPPGREVWPPPGPEQPFPPRVPSTHLVFACPPAWLGSGPVNLVFGRVCGGPPIGPLAPLYILSARFYMAVHTLTAQRLPDLASVPIFDVSLSADSGSFAWTFSASGPTSLFDQLAPSAGLPAQIRVTLDGAPFVFVVDSIQREERFGQRGARISGRSVTALLARPYARETTRTNTSAALAQQLALDALDTTGVGLDWGLTDWLVSAGAWSYLGTPLAALQTIVEAAGGYLQSHRSAATLLARHPYPELAGGLPGGPWNWYAPGVLPDVELAPDALITQRIERRDGPDINGVYVSGTTQGVIALVRRTGSAADKLASLITDPLINAQEVALQRGLAALGAAGPKHLVQVDLPVLTGAGQPGVLDVGQLVQVNTSSPWRGRVRSVSVNAKLPAVRQSLQIERHLEVV
jgi:hypothetical protein